MIDDLFDTLESLTRASFQQAGQDAWQPLLNGMDKAWDQVLGQLERGLQA